MPEGTESGTEPKLEPGPTQTLNLASSHRTASPAYCQPSVGRMKRFPSQGDPECSFPRSKGTQMPLCSGMRFNPSPPSPVLGQSPAQECSSGASDRPALTLIPVDPRDGQCWGVWAQAGKESGPWTLEPGVPGFGFSSVTTLPSHYFPEFMLLSYKMGRIKHLLRALASLLP